MRSKFIFILVLMFSCDGVVMDIDPPAYTKSLILGGAMMADSMTYLSITENKGILNNSYDFDPVQDALVNLYEDGAYFTTLQLEDGFRYVSYEKPSPGKSYMLKIEKFGHEDITVVEKIPGEAPVFEVKELYAQENEYSYYDFDLKLVFNVKIKDRKGIDYYHLLVRQSVTVTKKIFNDLGDHLKDTVYKETKKLDVETKNYTDLVVKEHVYSYLIFSDELFDGQTYNADFVTGFYKDSEDHDIYQHGDPYVTIELRKISEAMYKYLDTYQLQWDNEGFPFAETVQVFSNVENGKGIFGAYTSSTLKLYPQED